MNKNFQLHSASASRHAGFTFLELFIVLAILALLGGLLLGPKVVDHFGESKVKTSKMQIKELEGAAKSFKSDVGRYPSTAEGLRALRVRPAAMPSWNGPYIDESVTLKDPWGKDYFYRSPGKRGEIDIYTLGADHVPGGEGENADIGN